MKLCHWTAMIILLAFSFGCSKAEAPVVCRLRPQQRPRVCRPDVAAGDAARQQALCDAP